MRVDFRIRQRKEFAKRNGLTEPREKEIHPLGQTNCGVAAVIGTENVPSFVLDEALHAMKNRGMDGVGVGKTLCFPEFPDAYAYRVMVKGRLQLEMEAELRARNGKPADEAELRRKVRANLLKFRYRLAGLLKEIFLDPCFDYQGETDLRKVRESYKKDERGRERDYRDFGNPNTDPGDVFRFFVRVKPAVLTAFIEDELLRSQRYEYIREYFPDVTVENYRDHADFLRKAEDLYVFNHQNRFTQILYQWDVKPEMWEAFLNGNAAFADIAPALLTTDPFEGRHLDSHGRSYLEVLRTYLDTHPYSGHGEHYQPRVRKIAAVMSCGKNFAVWKTAGREIPWETPASPNNIIHVRLATGSVVEQMNAHPFGKLNTALTHNGETTNYETLKQRVEQFGLPPLATTDTEVASLKFHLVAEELEYPDWALFESFSPTTGDDLELIPAELRHQLEEVQRVEFTSSPDGPYQYLCLRHLPEKGVTERVDLKDPADLRPGTTALWYNVENGRKRGFSIIASEEQAAQKVLELLDREGVIDGAAPDRTLVSNGMINRFAFDAGGKVVDFHLVDRYGRDIPLADPGTHYSVRRSKLRAPAKARREALLAAMRAHGRDLAAWLRGELAAISFNDYRWVMKQVVDLGAGKGDLVDIAELAALRDPAAAIAFFTYFIDYLRTMDSGEKAKSSLLDVTRHSLYQLLDALPENEPGRYRFAGLRAIDPAAPDDAAAQTLLVDATGFEPEGIDPRQAMAAFLSHAYDLGWRRFLLYRVNGQRLISTAVMGTGDTDDVEIDVYGTPGEYFGAFMQGGTVRCHGNAQNFCAMGIHHGNLYVYGNAGKVCGYASKGGKIVILGDIVDRAWTNSVNDPRCQDLQIFILGSASKYCGESLMGGDFFFGGMYFDHDGTLRLEERPYRGTKLMGGASRGNMLFFDPENRLDARQHRDGKIVDLDESNWPYWKAVVRETLELAGAPVRETGGEAAFTVDRTDYFIVPEHFKLIVPRGGLKGYESH